MTAQVYFGLSGNGRYWGTLNDMKSVLIGRLRDSAWLPLGSGKTAHCCIRMLPARSTAVGNLIATGLIFRLLALG
ncbi:MAG: hypothetical protein ACF8CQ_06410 [Rhodopirellula sp. JB044]|uniref:hypothetical protein n=1 Tax=Rhodopirellula sp. JB044 TaxID=3342844 RepID=UPI003709D9D2